jgi:putative flippase GtrA
VIVLRNVAARSWTQLPAIVRQVLRFGSVSATALVVDVCAYATLVQTVHPAALAAFFAYAMGGIWHYLISCAVMFRAEMPNLPPLLHIARFLRYFASTLAGLLVTMSVVGLTVDMLGMHPLAGKAMAVPLSFLTVFLTVKMSVFRR